MPLTGKMCGQPIPIGRLLAASQVRLVLLLLMGLGGIVGCSASWRNSRTIYLRNQTAADLLLTWKIPCARLQPAGPWSPGVGLMEPGGLPPRLLYSLTDTLLDNYEQTVPLHSQPAAGDSILLTVKIPPGTTYLISSYEESFQHSDPDRHEMGGFTFLPCTIRWLTTSGHPQHRFIHPFEWRQEQDQEANNKWTNSYELVRYFDCN